MRKMALLAAVLVASCATVPPRLLPLVLASDQGWSGRIIDTGLMVSGIDPPISVARAPHLTHGGGNLLLNSVTDQGEYISLWVQLGRCEAGGRVYPYSLSACVAPPSGGSECRVRLKGCAAPADSRFRSEYDRATTSPAR